MSEAAPSRSVDSPASGRRLLAILLPVFIFNFVDRQIIGVLAVPIKADLGISDTQLGLMGGLAFAIMYSGLGIPIAMLADRRSRVTIVSISLAIWSAFTAMCGLTQNFWQLFLTRIGVGIGEAGGLAPCYSLVSDTFPAERRGRALAILSLGIPIGSAAGIAFGGWVATALSWRAAFLMVGLPGLLLVPLVRFGIKEPVRGRFDGVADAASPPAYSLSQVLRTLAAKPSFWLLSLGAAGGGMVGYGLMFWLPVFFHRSMGLNLSELGLFYGSIVLVGGVIGLWTGGSAVDRRGKKSIRAYATLPAIFAFAAAPAYAAAIMAPSLAIAWPLFVLGQVMGLSWYAPILAAMQHIAPAPMRATVSAIYLFIQNLLGIGVGTFFFGYMSDVMTVRYGDQALKYSILYGLGFYLAAGLLFLLAVRRIEQDWSAPRAGHDETVVGG